MPLRSGTAYNVVVKEEPQDDEVDEILLKPVVSKVERAKQVARARAKKRQQEKAKEFHERNFKKFAVLMSGTMREFDGVPEGLKKGDKYDPEMHRIRTLIKMFDVLNDSQYEKVLMDSRNLRFRHMTLQRCESFKDECNSIIRTRILAARDIYTTKVRKAPHMRNKVTNIHAIEDYYTSFRNELDEKIDEFYNKYCNRL